MKKKKGVSRSKKKLLSNRIPLGIGTYLEHSKSIFVRNHIDESAT